MQARLIFDSRINYYNCFRIEVSKCADCLILMNKALIASAQKSRTLEDEMKKMKSKVTMEELDQHHSRMMLKYYVEDDPDEEKVVEYSLKIANNDCKLA